MQHGPAGNHSKARRAASAGSSSSSSSALPTPVAPMAFTRVLVYKTLGLSFLPAGRPVVSLRCLTNAEAGSRFLLLHAMLLAIACQSSRAQQLSDPQS